MSEQKNIRAIRKARGMTQDEFAKALDVSRVTISNWEGGTHVPLLTLARIVETSHPGEKRRALALEMMGAYLDAIKGEEGEPVGSDSIS